MSETNTAVMSTLLEMAGRVTATTLLVAVLYTGWRGDWVWASQYREVQEAAKSFRNERDEWKMLALRATNLAERDRPLIGAAAKERDTAASIRARLETIEESQP